MSHAAWACTGATSPGEEPPPHSRDTAILVEDGFTRQVKTGWADADVGGTWRIDADAIGSFRVDGSRGQILMRSIHPLNAVATEGYGRNVRGLVSFSIDRVPDNPDRFHTVQVYARRDDRLSDGDNYYRFRVRAFGTGKMDVRIEKNVDQVRTWLAEAAPAPAVWMPGNRYWIRWECIGSRPSTVQIRIWPDGEAEPAAWHMSIAVDEPALDVPGTTGIHVEGPDTDQRSFPIIFSFDDMEYSDIP